MARSKIGFLNGVGGNSTGWGEYLYRLDHAGIPAIVVAYDDYGYCVDALRYQDLSGIEHVVAFHMSLSGGVPHEDDYGKDPIVAGAEMYQRHLSALPPEWDSRTWLLWGNEGRHTPDMFNWWGDYAHTFTTLALADGIKTMAFGWSAGTPEHGFWDAASVRNWMALANQNPGMVGVHVHEGTDPRIAQPPDAAEWSPIINPPENDITGRYHEMLAACDDMGIPPLPIIISECAWRYDDAPPVETAMAHIDEAARYYNEDVSVLGVTLWYLGGDAGEGVANKVQQYIGPVTDYTMTTVLPDPSPAPGPVPPPAKIQHTIHLLPQDTTLVELQAVTKELHPTRSAFTYSADVVHAVMYAGIQESSKVVIWSGERWTDDIYAWMDQKNISHVSRSFSELIPDDNRNPVDGLIMGQLFRVPYTQTGAFGDSRPYGPHEGADYDIVSGPVDSKEPVLCLYDGVVYRIVRQTGGYYNYVVVRHTRFNKPFFTWYAHLDAIYVNAGQNVVAGDSIGELGSTGSSTSEHVHVNLEVPGFGQITYEGHEYVDPAPHIPAYQGPPATNAKLGLHSFADGGVSSDAEIQEFVNAKVDAIKVMSSTSDHTISRLLSSYPGISWIVRVFQEFRDSTGIRNITPQQFFEWNEPDVVRSLGVLAGALPWTWIELHNEPNLRAEGWTGSWQNGSGFSSWLLSLIGLYRNAHPNVKLLYPGLSPGGYVAGVRYDHWAFLEESRTAINACDGLAIHLYWSPNYSMALSLSVLDETISRFPGKPIWITEASNNGVAAFDQKGREYIKFWQEIGRRPAVQGVTYFVADATNPEFANQVWKGNGIGSIVGSRG